MFESLLHTYMFVVRFPNELPLSRLGFLRGLVGSEFTSLPLVVAQTI